MIQEYNVALEDINKVIDALKKVIDNKNRVVLLQGDLASGKTTLVKSYLQFSNSTSEVTSPTFCIQNVYDNNFYHYDVYNKTLEEFISLGLLEEFEKEGVHFVEWGDDTLEELLKSYGFDIIKITIEKLNNKRRYTIHA
ncbi:MAG: tRNA (adenosine(37)-N6)-threonylcarbamoyltransferase complex ATPase subunit type 1 TsaE [Arcobacteraceae bacterium]